MPRYAPKHITKNGKKKKYLLMITGNPEIRKIRGQI
jgi:hypothetical protein